MNDKYVNYTLIFSDFPISFSDIILREGAVVYRYSKNTPMNATEPRFFSEYENAKVYDDSFGNGNNEIWECKLKKLKLIDFRMLKYIIYTTIENIGKSKLDIIEKSKKSHLKNFILNFLNISGLMPVSKQNDKIKDLQYPLQNYGYRHSIHNLDDYVLKEFKKHFEDNYDGYISPTIPAVNEKSINALICEICLFNPSKCINSAKIGIKSKFTFTKNLNIFNKSMNPCTYSHKFLNMNSINKIITKPISQIKLAECKLLSFHTFDLKWGVIDIPENLVIFRASKSNPISTIEPRWFGNYETSNIYKKKYNSDMFLCIIDKNVKLVDIRILKYIILEISLYLNRYNKLTEKMLYKLDCFMTVFGLHPHKLQLLNISKAYNKNDRESPYKSKYDNKHNYVRNSGSRLSYGPLDDIAVSYINDLIGHKIDGYISPNLETPFLSDPFKHEICLLNPNKCIKKTFSLNKNNTLNKYIKNMENFNFNTLESDCKFNINKII